MKLSEVQKHAIRRVATEYRPLMPYADEQRTFTALENKGLIVYRRIEDNYPNNGYELTDEGKQLWEELEKQLRGG